MHLTTDTMTSQLAHYSIPVGFAMVLHCTANVTKMMTSNCLFDAQIERLLGNSEQLFDFGIYLTYTKCIARISTKSIEQRSAIYRNDIAIL